MNRELPTNPCRIPFGLGRQKPRHFRDMLRILWENRDNLRYAWKVLSRGVCDGCALGVTGFRDWTMNGVHLCMTRLNLLRLNTQRVFDPALVADLDALRRRLEPEMSRHEPFSPDSQTRGPSDPVSCFDNARLRDLGRIPAPLLRQRGDPGFRRISWEEALERIARRIRGIDPRRLAFFLTARALTNEVYYVAQKVARFLGTNNIDNAARLCHSPSTGAMKHALGVAASTCSYRDWYGTDLLVFFGSNPANDQPVAMKYIHEARRLGTRVVLVNPFLEPGMRRYWVPSTLRSALFGTRIADHWYPVAQGGDVAFLYGVLKVLRESGGLNERFIAAHTAGFEALANQLDQLDFNLLEARSGLSRADMTGFAALLQSAGNAVFVWSMGITQHACGGDAVSMILNLGLARGYVGRPRNGLMPIRGHSGVQGGAEMGAYATAFPGGLPVNPENARALADLYGFAIPAEPGLTATDMVEAGARGDLDVLYCLGGNFLRTLPDPAHVAHALSRIPLRVHQDIILTDQMFLEPADEVILLPAKTRYEQDDGGTETTTERRILFSPELPRPAAEIGEARAEWRILRDLAATVHPDRIDAFNCGSGQAIREEIARVIPFYDGIQRLRQGGDSFQYGGRHLCANGHFPTPDGQARFRVVTLPGHPATTADTAPETRPFKVSTRRGKQFNTLVYAAVDPLTGAARDAVFMNPDDAAFLRLQAGDPVTLINSHGCLNGRVFPTDIAPGNLQVHWPEGNLLIPRGLVDALGGVPDYNAWVTVKRRD